MAFVQAEMSQVWKSVVSPEEMADGTASCAKVCGQGQGTDGVYAGKSQLA